LLDFLAEPSNVRPFATPSGGHGEEIDDDPDYPGGMLPNFG